ncbi:hypothetical protein BKE38_12115 [Pseudoroseomonas deserti]|uniref:Uncharacterized protein n=1 Tax=Teichococcus deserti TaxID=1817963 RepID=A0A1V2H2C4_9PROT|nr:hypothetical protein [Pseudoroseomonas deserti]ONG53453.1 hypothetical protein BKE38_12115 [Pseudoroseomonas deserti]
MSLTPALGRDDAALLTPRFCAVETSLTAGGAGDNAEITGGQIDLRDDFGTKRFASLTLVLAARATLTAGQALALKAVRFEHSDDANTWSDVEPGATVLTLPSSAGGTVTGAAVLGCNLLEAKRFVRAKFTPDLSAGTTDVAKVGAVYVLSSPTEY